MSYLSYSKNFEGVLDLFLRDSKRYLPFAQFIENVMSADSELSKAQKEMIAVYVSRLNDCHYCVDSHSCVLNGLGGDKEIVSSIADKSIENVDKKFKAVLEFAKKLTLEPAKVSETDVKTVRLAGWSDQTIEDAICVVSVFSCLNRLIDGCGIKGSKNHFQEVGGMIAQQGYSPLVQMIAQKAKTS